MFQCASRRFMMKKFASSINNKISLSKLSLLKVKTMAVSRSFNTRLLYNSLSCKILRDTVMNSKSILSSLKFSSFSTSLIVPCQNYCLNKRCYSTTHKKITKNVKMEAILKDFEKLNKNDSIDEVSKILEELINITLTPEEYNTYLSFFEEITYFAKERIHQISNQNQILTFIQFFILKDESDIPLWDEINAAALRILPELDIDIIN